MGSRVVGALAVAIVLVGIPVGCAIRRAPLSMFGEDPGVPDAGPSDEYVPDFPETGSDDSCHGFACKPVKCPNGLKTRVTGTVYDPAGFTPLYGVAVYVPSMPVSPIPDGIDQTKCTPCAAPLSGNPIAVALTDSHGQFTLDDVPPGKDIPIVVQTGKFRREGLTIPTLVACQDNAIDDPQHDVRLPRSQAEGHLPLMAITTGGCEGLECVVRTYGFDDSEFTSASGGGRFHLYQGTYGGQAMGSTSAYAFWGSSDVFKYDMILNSCECAPHPRDPDGPAYANMEQYLDHGGRLFTSDFQYNWFTDTQAPADLKSVAHWDPGQTAPPYSPPYFIDTSFPRGKALDDWMQFVFSYTAPPKGQIWLDDVYSNVDKVSPGATRWIYATDDGSRSSPNYEAKYLSFNTPVSADPDAGAGQCGRAVFADIHVSEGVHTTVFPNQCGKLSPNQQTTAFEFLFFDMASCVQKDSEPPQPPPVN